MLTNTDRACSSRTIGTTLSDVPPFAGLPLHFDKKSP